VDTSVIPHSSSDSGANVVGDRLIHDYMSDLHSRLPNYLPILDTGMHHRGQSKYVSWHFPTDAFGDQPLELLHITDVQFGHKYCRKSRVREYRDWVLSEPNRYVLLGGDLVDAGHILSKGSPFDQEGDPQSEVYDFCEEFAPLRPRILGYVGGNHERRSIPTFGDLGVLIATMLKIPYSDGKQMVDIYYGKHKPFKVSLHHSGGSKSAQTKGAIANVIYKFMSQGDSQLYLVGHLHQALVLPDWREERLLKEHDIKLVKVIGAMSTSFLKTYGTYAEVAGFKPGDVMMARAVLETNGKWEVTLR
jgi:hypothetical protein